MSGEVVHRLGVVLCIALAAVVASAVVADRRARALRLRLERLLGVEPREKARSVRGPERRAAVRRWAPVVSAGCLAYALVGGPAGLVVGVAAGLGVWRWWRRRLMSAPAETRQAEQAGRQLPLAADLLAACIAAGAGPVEAASAVGESLGGPVGERLAGVAGELRLGGEPGQCWGRLASIPEAAALARCLQRAADSGAPAAEQVARVATDCRQRAARSALTRAHRASVMVTAPVGLCFLPAFLVLGVVPVVVGLAGEILQGV
ncbi:type II secretion system F family protein [Streptomyces sp. TRM66268-LWL]|uniref:Type II secretion system F family protein n=1 Tax=Streptomyces polyasparticus TaxID=2767826 RepID=A0ABR7SIA2_9ACTN|nr:type II secretion system F family protein [Streptomyces polyasparticus]MBC9714674.1 type II secretion system F family protein [Streptomyces polyasparticus]